MLWKSPHSNHPGKSRHAGASPGCRLFFWVQQHRETEARPGRPRERVGTNKDFVKNAAEELFQDRRFLLDSWANKW
jgi:hypothetical protein